MVKSVYVDKAGEILEFPDTTTPQQIREYINRAYGAAQSTAAPAPEAPVGPDESGVFGRFAYGFGTGLTNIPGGIAALGLPAEKAAKTSAGQFSEEARKYLQETFGIDPTKDPTAAQQAAEALGSVASFLVPGSAVAKGVSLIGRTASLAGRAGAATAAAQGVALGSGARAEKIQSQLASGMEISEEDQLAAQRLDGLIGASEALPLGRFFGPINTLLSKVPLAKAPIVEQIVKSRLAKVTRSGLAEGAQEVASGIANDLVEMGVYNPDVELGQDLMSNFGTGAFAGSFVEGLIQLAAGRKLRPYRQLEEDLGKESALNAQAQRQGEISRAAEELRKINVQGDVEIVEDEFDGISRFVVRTPAGNTVGDFLDAAEAEEAVNIYKQRTDANITIRKPAELPSVFPVKINGKEYTTTNDVIADRDSIVSKKEGLAAYMSRPDVIKREAARQNVSEDLVKKATAEEVADLDKQIVKLNEFVAAAKPTPTIVSPASAPDEFTPEQGVKQGFTFNFELNPEESTRLREIPREEGTVTPTETIAQEAPVGVAEAVSTEAPITEAPAIVEAPAPSVGPVEATGNRTLAGPLKEAPTPRRTLSQAEAEGPIVRDYNQATINRYAGIYTALKSRLAGKVPKNAEIKLEELISTPASLLVKGRARVEKTPNGIKSIVDLSTGILRPDMTVEDAVNELIGTLDHEIIHVLRDQGLIRPTEWNMLSKAATSTKVPGRAYTYLDKAQTVYTPGGQPISPIYANPDSVIEEAVAEMYKDWVKGNNRKEVRRVGGLFNRITEFFRSIFRILKSNKHQDIFKAIDTGEIGAREGVGREADTRLSAANMPPESNAQKTQIPGTFPTYKKASEILNKEKPDGKQLDFGAGLGMSQQLGFDTFEPYPRSGFTPTYNDSGNIQSNSYDKIVNLNVLNVVPIETRSKIVKEIGRILSPGGIAIITARGRDVMNARGTPGSEPMSIITSANTYQKGFTPPELVEYVSRELGEGFVVERLNLGPAGVFIRKSGDSTGEATRFSAAPALNSEEFSKWFKRSKAVDVDGTPLVVYHGTMSNFSSFDRNKLQSATGGFEDSLVGFMFTNNPRAAAMFSLGDKRGISGQVMPVYLSVQNPLVLDLSDAITVKIDGIPKYTDGAMMSAAEKVLGIKLTSSWGGPLDGSGENMLNALRAQGYDGVHVKNSSFGAVTPAKERNVGGRVGAWDVWIALDPEQVKSKMNPFEEGAATSPRLSAAPALNSAEFKKWFRSSKIVDASGKPLVVYHGTADVFDEFKQDTGGKKDRGWLGRGFYFTNNTGVANAYAMIKRGFSENVIPVYISVQNPYYATLEEKAQLKAAEQSGDTFAAQEFTDKLKAAGHDGVVLDYRSEDGAKEYVIFDAAQAKSIFNEFKEGAATSPRLSAAPLPPYVEAKNRTLFVPEEKRSFVKDMFDFFFGPPASGRTLNTIYGQIDVKSKTRLAVSARTAIVDMDAAFEFLEKTANQKDTGNFQRREATQSTIVSLGMARRSSQLTAATVTQGAPIISFSRPGDIQSATVSMRNDADRLIDIFKVMLEPGPVDSVTSERKDKRTVFKMYASAKRAIGLKAAGLAVPSELDDTYINTTIPFVQQNYPEIVEAYEKYQRFNKKLITAARDAGRITDADLAKYTQQMDYYGFYREVYEEQLVPGMPSKLAGDIKIREYKGSQRGELIEDPMLVILTNVNFWMGAITRNIATNKAFKLAKDMGEARLLGASEKPDLSQGESEQVMFFRENGVQKRFAVKDPLLVTSLGADDGADMGAAMRLIGLPTTALRESVTRDPVFMVRNLLRDTLSSWITSGEDITPFIGTINGFRKALNNSSSYQALIGRGVVGSHDLAMRSPAEMAAIIRRRALPKGIMDVTSIDGMQGLIMSGWDRLGVWSEASDAATRIAVYESAIKQGMSEAEAAFRAIEIMNFSRRGSSSFLQILTRLVPFLNARIQGMDVLYQAGKAGVMTATGYQLGERDANLGKKFLYRGAILAAISVGLQMMLDGDEDYEEIPDYVKNGNILLPLKWLGVEGGYFAAVPKPFEAGLLFSTIPQELYKATTGQASGREMANFFWSEFVSTFGVNPVPQFLLPAGEAITNYDVYTGLPLISEGKARLTPELQYDARTSSVAMMLGDIPIKYNFTTGKFEGVSPIIIDQLISGYGGPMGSYFMQGIGLLMEGADVAPERLPKDITQLPGIKSFLLDAESRSPKSVAQAYELFRVVDEVNRSFSRLRQTGDVEATMDYLEQNKNVLAYKKHIYRLFDGLNKLSARERQIERDETMTRDEKFAAMKQLREVRARLTSNIGEINKALGR